jgi:hypothetical protein
MKRPEKARTGDQQKARRRPGLEIRKRVIRKGRTRDQVEARRTPGAETWKWLGDVEDLGPGRGQEKAWTRYQGWPEEGQNETRRRQVAMTRDQEAASTRPGLETRNRPGQGQDEARTRPGQGQDERSGSGQD